MLKDRLRFPDWDVSSLTVFVRAIDMSYLWSVIDFFIFICNCECCTFYCISIYAFNSKLFTSGTITIIITAPTVNIVTQFKDQRVIITIEFLSKYKALCRSLTATISISFTKIGTLSYHLRSCKILVLFSVVNCFLSKIFGKVLGGETSGSTVQSLYYYLYKGKTYPIRLL